MTINPHTGEYTHEDLTTLRTRFESLLDSGPVHITWHHITTKNAPTATATHHHTLTTTHPTLTHFFNAATHLSNGTDTPISPTTLLTAATYTHREKTGHPCTQNLTSIHSAKPSSKTAHALAEIQQDQALHAVVSDWLHALFTLEHPLAWSTSASAMILAGQIRHKAHPPTQAAGNPLTSRINWIQQWCEQHLMTSTWETGQDATLRHLQASSLNAYAAARIRWKAHLKIFTIDPEGTHRH
mgnify:FL=1|jgi:hypothetical protein